MSSEQIRGERTGWRCAVVDGTWKWPWMVTWVVVIGATNKFVKKIKI